MLLACGIGLRAESNYLHIATDSGWDVIDLSKSDRLTFIGGVMKVTDAAGNVLGAYPQETLDHMHIDQSSGTVEIISGKSEETFSIANNGRLVRTLSDGAFEIFTLDGAVVVEIPTVASGQTIDLSGLASGCYIYRIDAYAVKVVVK